MHAVLILADKLKVNHIGKNLSDIYIYRYKFCTKNVQNLSDIELKKQVQIKDLCAFGGQLGCLAYTRIIVLCME